LVRANEDASCALLETLYVGWKGRRQFHAGYERCVARQPKPDVRFAFFNGHHDCLAVGEECDFTLEFSERQPLDHTRHVNAADTARRRIAATDALGRNAAGSGTLRALEAHIFRGTMIRQIVVNASDDEMAICLAQVDLFSPRDIWKTVACNLGHRVAEPQHAVAGGGQAT